MTDREKLIELVHGALEKCNTTPCWECKYSELNSGCNDLCFEHLAADYLISNGVTIPVMCEECNRRMEDKTCYWWGGRVDDKFFCAYRERREDDRN